MTKEANKDLQDKVAQLTADVENLTAENEKLIAENDKLTEDVTNLTSEKDKLEKTIKRMETMAEKGESYLNQLVAIKNDFESYKRRMRLNTEDAKQEGIASVVGKLLDIADTFDIAQTHITDADTLKAFDMVYDQLKKLFAEVGVTKMEVMGCEFDHNTMNALSSMDRGEENKGKVVEVYKQGYTFNDKILRYAEVIVGA